MTGAWLFVRGGESIWLQRSSTDGFELDMHGPLTLRRHYSFASDHELDSFLADVEGRLTPAGWALQRFEPGQDRRTAARPAAVGSERRGAAAAGEDTESVTADARDPRDRR
jgi:hypothetical protein